MPCWHRRPCCSANHARGIAYYAPLISAKRLGSASSSPKAEKFWVTTEAR